jgi:NhaP-type Na+/H+ or K+/H+ antiporter
MDVSLSLTLLIVVTVLAGIGAQVLGAWLRLPSIVFLLLFGVALGRDGLGWIQPDQLGTGLEVLVALSVALILFEGGFSLELRDVSRVSGPLRNLITLGMGITWVGGAMAAHWLCEFPWPIAALFAAIVVVTGPTVTGPLLRQVQADRAVATILEGEGILIDPLGVILAVVVLDIVLNGSVEPVQVASGLLTRLGTGGAIGFGGGWLLGQFLKRASFLTEDLKNLVVLAGAWGLFGLAQSIRSEAGLMAAVSAGIALKMQALPGERLLKRFKGQLTVLAISVLFILLAADLSIDSILALGWGGLWTVLVLMLVVRPISVMLCTWGHGLSWQQRLFMSWIAPRGIISASVASLFSILLTDRGINGGDANKALVFLTILMTVVVQGITARPLAQLLGVTSTQASGAVILGSNALSRLLAQLLRDRGETVVILDSDADACAKAEAQNLRAIVTTGFESSSLEDAGITNVGTFLALSTNGDVNQALAQRVYEEFHPPRVMAAAPDSGDHIETACIDNEALKTWSQYLDDGDVKLGQTELRDIDFDLQQAHLQALMRSKELIPLLIERDDRFDISLASLDLKAGDRLIYLLHDPTPKLMKRLGGGSTPQLTIETVPIVEAIPAT